MVTYTDILKAVNKKITGNFPKIQLDTKTNDIDIQASDTKNKLIRPSFRTTLDGIKIKNLMNTEINKEMTVRVYYFPKYRDKYKIELLEIQQKLVEVFIIDNQLIITSQDGDTYTAEIENVDIDTIDGVLHFYFDLELYEQINRIDTHDNMEDLQFDTEINK